MSDISTNTPPQHSTFGMVIGQSHFATEATLEEDGYDSDNEINPMNTIINKDSMEDNDAALPEVSDELAVSGEQETQENGGNFVNVPEDSHTKK